MTVKLSTTINSENKQLLVQFFDFMKRAGTSEKYQNNNLKAIIAYSKSLEPSISFYEIENKSQIISFLDTKIKNSEDDPDKRIWFFSKDEFCILLVLYIYNKLVP